MCYEMGIENYLISNNIALVDTNKLQRNLRGRICRCGLRAAPIIFLGAALIIFLVEKTIDLWYTFINIMFRKVKVRIWQSVIINYGNYLLIKT